MFRGLSLILVFCDAKSRCFSNVLFHKYLRCLLWPLYSVCTVYVQYNGRRKTLFGGVLVVLIFVI